MDRDWKAVLVADSAIEEAKASGRCYGAKQDGDMLCLVRKGIGRWQAKAYIIDAPITILESLTDADHREAWRTWGDTTTLTIPDRGA